MPGLNASLYLGLTGIQAQQSALNVVGHNIANVNTPGYARQRADLSSNQALVEGQVYFGTGVSLNTVQGIRDRFLDLQIYREVARQSGANERYAGVDAVSASLGDTSSTGIAAQVQAFFQGFQEVSARPEDGALRASLIGKAQNMISGLQARYRLLDEQRESANFSVSSLVKEVNTLTDQIAQLNKRIATEGTRGEDNDARDQRKTLTDKLANLVGIHVFEGSQGEYQITLDSGSAVLVSGNTLTDQIAQLNKRIATEGTRGEDNDARDQRKTLTDKLANLVGIHVFEGSQGEYQITLDSGSAVLVSGNTSYDLRTSPGGVALDNYLKVESVMGSTLVDVTASIQDGQLGAKLDLRDNILSGFQRQLDELAAGVAGRVNLLHRTGFAADGVTTGNDFFQSGVANGADGLPVSISAANFYKGMVNTLSVNSAVSGNPMLVAAARIAGVRGDNDNAKDMASLQTTGLTVDTTGDGVGDTGPFSSFIGSLVNDVGTKSQAYEVQSATQQNLVAALQAQRDRISGVDLDEEAAHLMTLQRGYQASARFISVINQLTDQLVNQFGR